MEAFLLLLLTMVCAYLTFETFRLRGAIKKTPFSVIASLWGKNTNHLSLSEKQKIKENLVSFSGVNGIGDASLIFLVITVILAIATFNAFVK